MSIFEFNLSYILQPCLSGSPRELLPSILPRFRNLVPLEPLKICPMYWNLCRAGTFLKVIYWYSFFGVWLTYIHYVFQERNLAIDFPKTKLDKHGHCIIMYSKRTAGEICDIIVIVTSVIYVHIHDLQYSQRPTVMACASCQ